jgi:uncharacterized SAM-binding protein YcdF (DUF218 family)
VKKILALLVVVLAAGAAFVESSGFTPFWRRWLEVVVPMSHADALIVLGGEAEGRPLEAARLFHRGVAPRVFVTGTGDAGRNRQVLLAEGVPSDAIVVEDKARTTHENAIFLLPLLTSRGLHSALIVTSPFHTRRALATFRSLGPGIDFGTVPATLPWWKEPGGRREMNRYAVIEGLKILEYLLLYGISPLAGSPSAVKVCPANGRDAAFLKP